MPRRAARLTRDFFSTDPVTLAPRLIGQKLVRVMDDGTRLAGIIVEAEAYLGIPDRAAHTFGGRRTPRNEAMYGPPGTAYIYFTYGCHYCMNIVCGRLDEPVAVLIRALEPVEGIDHMRRVREAGRRTRSRKRSGHERLKVEDLCRGPGRLCEALDIGRELNGIDLTRDSRLFLEPGDRLKEGAEKAIGTSPRIGIESSGDWAIKPLRWFSRGSAFVSGSPRVNR